MRLNILTWPLSRQILGLALLNLILLLAVVVAFAEWQFGFSIESIVIGPARDRIVAIANAFGRDLDLAPESSRDSLLMNYSGRFDADFYLCTPDGERLAGEPVSLPAAVLQRMRRGNGPGHNEPFEVEPGFGRGGRGFPPPPGRPGALPADFIFLTITRNPLRYWVGVRIPTNGRNGERGVPAVLLLRSNSILNSNLFFDWRLLLWLGAALAAVALVCWWPFVHGVTQTIRQMDRATAEIAQGRFDVRVTRQRRDELGHLGQQINGMAERLQGFVSQQKRFLGDIAHELCAPIARIQFALGILEQRVDEAQQPHVGILREEIQEMSELVNELLMFSKAGLNAAELPLTRVDLAAAVQRAVSHQVAGVGNIEVSIQPGLAVTAHEPYVVRSISNLLRNALRYAGEAGPIQIVAERSGNQVSLRVMDCGPGLPEESLEEVFAPFYRPEAARSRDTGGTGLGLAIVKSCIEACRGSVRCRNRNPSGLEVTITLAAGADAPVAYEARPERL